MPRHCSATGCKSRDNKVARSSGVTFHRLPKKGNPRRATWIVNARRNGPAGKGLWEPQSDYIYFCSKHFTPDSFELSGVSGYRRLKDNAVPMLVEVPSGQKGKSSRGRGKIRTNEDRQLSTTTMTDNRSSESKKAQIKVSVVHTVGDEEAESFRTAKENHQNEKPPPLALPLQESAPDEATETPSTPPSPSRYMRRLPPPPGFYLAKEHSYAQLCPLEWRKRYEKATDNLEKALRLLRAARRRENRLRLQENRLKQTLAQIQDRKKESHENHVKSSQGRQSGKSARPSQDRALEEGMEETEAEGTGEEMELLAEESWRKERAAKLRDVKVMEDEEGCCFYCGRGREDEETKGGRDKVGSRRNPAFQSRRGRRRNVPNEHKETMQDMDESKGHSKPPVCQNVHPDQLTLLHSQPEMLLQMHALTGPAQSTAAFQEVTSSTQLQRLHLLKPDLSLLHPDTSTVDIGVTQSEDGGGGLCHVFLVPVSSENKENRIGAEGAFQETEPVLVTEETFQPAVSEQEGGLCVQTDDTALSHTGLTGNQNNQQTRVRAALVGGDVTQRLKEHLEGFQLQLSSEFID